MDISRVKRFIPLMIPDLQEEDIAAVVDVLKSGMLVQGKEVEAFEKSLEQWLGVKYVIAASNGTATLHMALKALGIGKGDEVIVPAFSYIATANVVELVGATPIFVDIELSTFNIDSKKIESVISPATKAIIPVHEFGLACNINKIKKIAEKYNLFLIEDAACALGAKEGEQYAGTLGHFGSFSFHPRKAISSGEGGVLTTNDDKLAEKIRILRNHGIQYLGGKMNFVEAGFNYRMTDFQAALVHSQFHRLKSILAKKEQLAKLYFSELNHSLIQLPFLENNKDHTWQTFHIVLDSSINRDRVIEELKIQGIGTNYGAQCIPEQTYYKEKYSFDSAKLFPNALKAYKQGLALPLYEKLDQNDIQYISKKLLKIVNTLC